MKRGRRALPVIRLADGKRYPGGAPEAGEAEHYHPLTINGKCKGNDGYTYGEFTPAEEAHRAALRREKARECSRRARERRAKEYEGG
jgi:hypothetical protein